MVRTNNLGGHFKIPISIPWNRPRTINLSFLTLRKNQDQRLQKIKGKI